MVLLYQHALTLLPPSSNTSSNFLKAVARALDITTQNSSAAIFHGFHADLYLYSPFPEMKVAKVSTQLHICKP